YAGIPYQVFGERADALALMIAWSRSPMTRSGCGSAAIFASTALSPSALSVRRPRRASAFSSWRRSLIATCSSSVNPSGFFPVAVVLLGDFCVPLFADFIVLPFQTGVSTPNCFAYSAMPPAMRARVQADRASHDSGLDEGRHLAAPGSRARDESCQN